MNPWDKAAKRILRRPDSFKAACSTGQIGCNSTPLIPKATPLCPLERGVNYFVLALERMGAQTLYSCEGHPTGFYIMFIADYRLALDIARAGFFRMEIDRRTNCFSIRLPLTSARDEKSRRQCLRLAAVAWERLMAWKEAA